MTPHSRSRIGRRAAGAAIVLLSAAAGTFALWACGPYFPNWILGTDESFLGAPGGVLRFEIQRLKVPADPFHAQAAEDPYQETADADTADLQKALGAGGAGSEVVARHAELRKALREHAAALAEYAAAASEARLYEQKPPPPPPGLPKTLSVPAGLPGEFADYLQGAVAYHQERWADAGAAWQRLLKRPAAERRMRSTWAAFMLGKAALHGDAKEAPHWFQTARELASHGFEDRLGLAAASLGWEARAELGLGHFDRALALYARQARSGDALALSSIQFTCRQALAKGPDALNPIARSAEAREIMTAFLVSDHHAEWSDAPPPEEGEEEGADTAGKEPKPAVAPDAAAWLHAIKAAGVKEAAGADRLAWAAYQGGDFAAARDWLQRASADSPMARWIRARLLLRDGKVAEAQKLLDDVARTLPSPDKEDLEAFDPTQGWGKVATPTLAHGEDGALLLTQGHYTEALDHFLRGGFWMEAAYIADRVLTVDELRKYVDASWPAKAEAAKPAADPQAAQGEEGEEEEEVDAIGYTTAGLEAPDTGMLGHALRYLLGRRLVRTGRVAEARAYLPLKLVPLAAALGDSFRDGHDAARPADQRARSLFQAACITRKKGMDLGGSENEPDWLLLSGGNYELSVFPEDVAARAKNKILVPGPDERKRAENSRVEPDKRFHYRYRAAALAREAAMLLPDGSEDKARMLATAGVWLQNRDPEAAAPFLKDLLSCCGSTRLGKEAARLRRLPAVPACEMGVP